MVVGSLTVETDVAIIGSGPGGYVAAIRAAQLGKDVMLIEQDKVGGVCLNSGCIPTKALNHASNFFSTIKEVEQIGITVKDYSVDVNKMQEWKNSILEKLGNGVRMLCQKRGVEILEGRGTFRSNNEIHVEGKSDVNSIKFKNAIIATGSLPIEIHGFSFENNLIMDSKEALSLKEVPKKLVIIGGGYIGTEMGTVYGKLGSEVHIVEAMDRLIPTLDAEIVSVVAKKLEQFNVHTHLNSKAEGFEEKDGRALVHIDENGNKVTLDADKVMVVVGRKPNSKDFGLENTKVEIDDHGFIKVNEQMKTSDENIFAIGDVVGQPMLAHKASKEGKVAAEVIAGQASAFDNKVIPFVVFNDPEIASVGMTKEQAEEKGHKVKVGKFPFTALGRAMTLNQTDGFVKMVADEESGILLGVHIVGANASDMISECTLAIEMGATLEDLALTIHPHPTMPESLMEAAEVTLGKGINIFSGK